MDSIPVTIYSVHGGRPGGKRGDPARPSVVFCVSRLIALFASRGSNGPQRRFLPERAPAVGRLPTPRGRRSVLLAAGMLLLCSIYCAFTWPSFTRTIDLCATPFCDFVQYYFPMGEAILRTGSPVPGFLYSPLAAILLAVFPPLGLDAALLIWGGLQVGLLVLCLLLFRRLVPARLPLQLLSGALILTSFPMAFNFVAGQVSVFILAALLGVLVLHARHRRVGASLLFAFAVAIKFYPLLFLVPFVGARDVRFVLYAVAACVTLLLLVPASVLGPGDTQQFYVSLLDAFRQSDWVAANVHSQYLPHVVGRLLHGLGFQGNEVVPLLRWIAYGVAAFNVLLVFLVLRARIHHAGLWSFQVLFLTIPLVLKTSWPHDFVFLPFAQAFLAWWVFRRQAGECPVESAGERAGATAEPGQNHAARTALMCLIVPSMVMSSVLLFNLLANFALYGYSGALLWADLLLLAATYVVLLPALRRKPMAQFRVDGS